HSQLFKLRFDCAVRPRQKARLYTMRDVAKPKVETSWLNVCFFHWRGREDSSARDQFSDFLGRKNARRPGSGLLSGQIGEKGHVSARHPISSFRTEFGCRLEVLSIYGRGCALSSSGKLPNCGKAGNY